MATRSEGRMALNHDWMNAGPIQMHVRSSMTSVMPELKWIHALDSDWDPFHAGGISAQLELGLDQIFFFFLCPHPSTLKKWVMDFSPYRVIVVKPCG